MSGGTAASPSQDDGWDWPYILYVGRVWLCYSEADIWKLTPRQFVAQMHVHEDITSKMHGVSSGRKAAQPTGFIDQIPGW